MKPTIAEIKPGTVLTDGRVVDSVELFTYGGGIIDFTNGDWEAYWPGRDIDVVQD